MTIAPLSPQAPRMPRATHALAASLTIANELNGPKLVVYGYGDGTFDPSAQILPLAQSPSASRTSTATASSISPFRRASSRATGSS